MKDSLFIFYESPNLFRDDNFIEITKSLVNLKNLKHIEYEV